MTGKEKSCTTGKGKSGTTDKEKDCVTGKGKSSTCIKGKGNTGTRNGAGSKENSGADRAGVHTGCNAKGRAGRNSEDYAGSGAKGCAGVKGGIDVSFRVCYNRKRTCRQLKVCARVVGTTSFVPRTLKGFGISLHEHDLDCWNSRRQEFDVSVNHEVNNRMLRGFKDRCMAIISEYGISSVDVLWGMLEKRSSTAGVTLGDFTRSYIQELREGRTNRLPSRNYQVFVTLLHHLERARGKGCGIIDTGIGDIGDRHFRMFGEYLCGMRQPNYIDIMKYFKRIHNVAVRKGLAQKSLAYRYSDDRPVVARSLGKGHVTCLSRCQLEAFQSMPLDKIPHTGVRGMFYKTLYRDTVMLMYHILSRPMDVFSLKWEDIVTVNGMECFCYNAIKKNMDGSKSIIVPISAKAMEILDRYRGMSAYILPYSENSRECDMEDPREYDMRYNRCRAMGGKVNNFLHKAARELGIRFIGGKNLTMYTFRHTAITHAINSMCDTGLGLLDIASFAGTSVKEIQKSYYDTSQKIGTGMRLL